MSEKVCPVCRLPSEGGAKRCANCGSSLERVPGTGLSAEDFVAPPKASNATRFVVMGALVAAGAIGALVLAQGPRQEEPQVSDVVAREAPIAEHVSEPHAQASAVVAEPAVPVPEVPVQPEIPPPSDETVTLHFAARVASAKGKGVSKGAKCTINVHVSGRDIGDVDVACGDTVLYDSRTPLNGMASVGSNLFERVKGKSWVYRAVYEDLGTRTSRSQLRLNTTTQQATAFSEGDDAFSVELRVDEFSQPREGSPLLGTDPGGATLQAELLFAAERGTPPKVARDKCAFESKFVETAQDGQMCKSQLRCGGTILYGKGTTGFGSCEVRGGTVIYFLDEGETHEDGDPALDFKLETVILWDSPGHAEYKLEFSVPPAAE